MHGVFYNRAVIWTVSGNVVHVEAMDHAFDVDTPDELPTGWITFVLKNKMAQEVHEISFARLPDGVTCDEYLTDYMGTWEMLLKE